MLMITILMISVVIPVYLFYWLTNGNTLNKSQLLIKTVGTGLFIYTLFIFYNWAFVSYYLRYIYMGFFWVAACYAWWEARHKPWRSRLAFRQWLPVFGGILIMVGSGFILVNVTGADRIPANSVEIDFPLKKGTYYISQAGSSHGMNGHMASVRRSEHRGQKWGMDITQVNILGARARGICPSDPDRYYIYGKPVYSPCNGSIIQTENRFPDHESTDLDSGNLFGNYILIECERGFHVVLANLRQESLVVAGGDIVSVGSRLAAIGNSGNRREPHLHIHAQSGSGKNGILDSEPLPVIFREHGWLTRNDRVRVRRR